jgi:tight adherence protein C
MHAVWIAMAGANWELLPIAVGVAAMVAATVAALREWFPSTSTGVVARIERIVARPMATAFTRAPQTGWNRLWSRLAVWLAVLARPSRAEELTRLRSHLVQGGLRTERAMEFFLTTKLLLAAGTTLVFLEINSQLPRGLTFPSVAGAALVICAAAFFLPNVWLALRVKERRLEIQRALPEAMDLLVTCVEAGLSLDAALGRVGDELKLVAPLLAAELNVTFLETQAGMARRESFRRLSERTGVEDLSQLAAVLTQTEMFGTSVARALRVHAEGMRIARMQIAERKAAMVGIKMTFPLVLCILPSLLAIVMGPAVASMMANMVVWR